MGNNKHLFQGSRVLELGGGMTCLAGCLLAVSDFSPHKCPSHIHLTDGNSASVANLELIVKRMKDGAGDKKSICDDVKAFQYRWDVGAAEEEQYDVIMCADCLFFKETSPSLVQS